MKIPETPPSFSKLIEEVNKSTELFMRVVGRQSTFKGDYLHWDEVRRRTPPEDLTSEAWWLGFVLAREGMKRPLRLRDEKSDPFTFAMPDEVLQLVHGIDRDASGRIELAEPVTNKETRDRYLVNSLIEESITSSQLEGASTTRLVAKDMIRTGRPPRDRSERMIMNNYSAMELIRANRDADLTPDFVLELHRVICQETLDDDRAAGRLRHADEDIRVYDDDGQVLHVPPDAASLAGRMREMCRFANEASSEFFVHPVVRAICLHFWLAYDHPFVDGNGRTARALFYWSMLKQGYWLSEFISISRVIKKAPAQYSRAFLYTETDNNDVTYFLIHQLRVVRRAIDELQSYLARKVAETRDIERNLRANDDLNHRQIALLSHALRHPDASYTIESHKRSHNVVHRTSRTDLFGLADKRLLEARKIGRSYVFFPVKDLDRRLGPNRGR